MPSVRQPISSFISSLICSFKLQSSHMAIAWFPQMDQFLYLPCMMQICSTTCDRRVNARLPQPLCLPLALRITSVPLFGLAAASVRFEDRAFKSWWARIFRRYGTTCKAQCLHSLKWLCQLSLWYCHQIHNFLSSCFAARSWCQVNVHATLFQKSLPRPQNQIQITTPKVIAVYSYIYILLSAHTTLP